MFLSDQEEGRKAAGNRESVLLLLTSFLRHAAKGFGPGFVGRTAQEKKKGRAATIARQTLGDAEI